MSDSTNTTSESSKPTDESTQVDNKNDKKGLDKFLLTNKPPVLHQQPISEVKIPDTEVPTEDVDYKEEIEKLQKEQYKMKRQQVLSDLSAINPEVAEKYKSSKLSELETALKVAKVVTPKFPVNREAPVSEAAPRGGFLNRRTGKWE